MMTAYVGGLRVSELINLKASDIDSKRMMIRVQEGKGSKDRYTILSPRLLEELRAYWKKYKPKYWLFTNIRTKGHVTKSCPHLAFERAVKKLGIKKRVTFHSLRHYVECYIMVSVTLQ